jgi:octaprenyl-diphosphate synthase
LDASLLIFALQKASKSEARHIIHLIRKKSRDASKVEEVINFVKLNGGLEYATEKMNEYKNKAIAVLEEFPDNEYKNSLIELINFTVTRKK